MNKLSSAVTLANNIVIGSIANMRESSIVIRFSLAVYKQEHLS